ncbi:hypothetical protein NHU_00723 [Rhodovulum sulfidophilum]|uniref:Uncharacterized protein n=1 Tax=Rhodovulum sulfidophilum TaxID=35806 RepID=A0A0D6AYR2_RHOSU|nr:hypothetical protein NHU_00723 [Rhodovulum sulfidophilum]
MRAPRPFRHPAILPVLAALMILLPQLALPQNQGQNQRQNQAIGRQCGPRDGILDQLRNRYGESRQAMGLAGNNAVVEIFANTRTGTWTVTGTFANGLTCLIASGEAYDPVSEPPGQAL